MKYFLFPSNLRQFLSIKGISGSKLASMLGVSQSTVSMWCTGSCEPCLLDLVRISIILDTTPDALLSFDTFRSTYDSLFFFSCGVIAGIKSVKIKSSEDGSKGDI